MTQEPIPSHGAQVRGRELVLDRCSRPEREKKKGGGSRTFVGRVDPKAEDQLTNLMKKFKIISV